MKKLSRTLLSLALLTFAAASNAQTSAPKTAPIGSPIPRKKMVQTGWYAPFPTMALGREREFEQRPFDGIVLELPDHGADVFDVTNWDEAKLKPEVEAMAKLKWSKFTDNFLRVNSASTMDWFSDDDWKKVLGHARWLARLAKSGGCVGLVFDPEAYGFVPWDYKNQQHAATKSLDEYSQMVRRRGADLMRVWATEMPNLKLLTFYQLAGFGGIAQQNGEKRAAMLNATDSALMPAFLNGLLDAATPGVTIIDGNEGAYYYTAPEQYYRAYFDIKARPLPLIAPENLRKYRTQVQVGTSIYWDNLLGYWSNAYAARTLSPPEKLRWLEHNAYYSLLTTDEYVWLYSEKANWWYRNDIPAAESHLPEGAEDALRLAKAKVAADAPLGFDIAELVAKTKAKLAAARDNPLHRSATITRINAADAPQIDGDIDAEKFYNLAPSLEPFIGYSQFFDDAKTVQETRAWIGYDDDNLYIGVRAREPKSYAIKSAGASTRDSAIWQGGDTLEVFLANAEESAKPEPEKFFHFTLNPANVQLDMIGTLQEARDFNGARTVANDIGFNASWRSAAKIADNQWRAEISIPWKELGMSGAPAPGTKLRANLARQRTPNQSVYPSGIELSTWSQTAAGFQEPRNFGTWIF